MNKELQKYYEAQFDMLSSDGWKDFLDDTKNLKESLPTVEKISTLEQLKYVQGQLDILNWLLERKKLIESAYEELTKEE